MSRDHTCHKKAEEGLGRQAAAAGGVGLLKSVRVRAQGV